MHISHHFFPNFCHRLELRYQWLFATLAMFRSTSFTIDFCSQFFSALVISDLLTPNKHYKNRLNYTKKGCNWKKILKIEVSVWENCLEGLLWSLEGGFGVNYFLFKSIWAWCEAPFWQLCHICMNVWLLLISLIKVSSTWIGI